MENNLPDQNNFKKFLNKKNILIILGVVITLEAIWAVWTLYNSSTPTPQLAAPPLNVQTIPTKITLGVDKTAVGVGEQLTVSINITSDKLTAGADLIITYDPKILSVVTSGSDKIPVATGGIYDDYPLNKVDQALGKITVSGISSSSEGIKPNGIFGSIAFKAIKAGQSSIMLEFVKGSTVDTNVTEVGTGQDVLESVENLNLNVSK